VNIVDYHTEGEVARIVTGGLKRIPGDTMAEKRSYAAKHLWSLLGFLTHEPRGFTSGAALILTEPTDPDADVGMLIMEHDTMVPMCGHGAIAVVTAIIEMGMVPAEEPQTKVILDTPAGLVTARAHVESGSVKSVTLQNVPSFLHYANLELRVPDLGRVTVDVAYGGDYYIIVPAERVGLRIVPEEHTRILEVAKKVREAMWSQVEIRHPEYSWIDIAKYVLFTAPPTRADASLKNTVVDTPGQIDRSPCGTGTCAKMAALYAKGELALGQPFVHESILGPVFRGTLLDETRVGSFTAVIPEFSGSAYIMSIGQLVLDSKDPFPSGFMLASGAETLSAEPAKR